MNGFEDHLKQGFINFENEIKKATRSILEWSYTWSRMKKSKYRSHMAPNGQNKKERRRNQTMLRGRRCRVHKGGYPTRGKGTTSRSHR